MNRQLYTVLIFTSLSVWLLGCGKTALKGDPNSTNTNIENNVDEKNKKPVIKDKGNRNSTTTADLKNIDTNLFRIDTVLAVPNYQLALTKERYNADKKKISEDDQWFNPITIYVIKTENDSIVYKQKFDENQFVTTFSFRNNSENYITLSSNGGGSGFISNLYRIETGKLIQFKNIFTYSELSYYSFNTDNTEILCLHGIWDLFHESEDGEIGETHFADHAYDIITVNLNEAEPSPISHGVTKLKYPSEDSGTTFGELLNLIQKKEPKLLKGIHVEKYGTQ